MGHLDTPRQPVAEREADVWPNVADHLGVLLPFERTFSFFTPSVLNLQKTNEEENDVGHIRVRCVDTADRHCRGDICNPTT